MTHDALVRTSEIAVTAVVLVLAVLLLGSLRRMPRNRRWLVVLACLLLYAVIVVPGAAVLWFAAFPLLAGVYPDGVMTPRWLWLPVGALALAAVGDLATGGMWSESPWWALVVNGQLVLLLAQVYRYRRRSSTAERAAVRWVILGTLLTMASFEATQAAYGSIGEGSTGSVVAAQLAVLPLFVAVAVGVLAPRALDVDEFLRATVVSLGTVAALAAVMLSLNAPAWVRLVTVAVVAAPVALGMLHVADWLLYRGRPDPDRAVTRMLSALNTPNGQHDTPSTVLHAFTGALFLDRGRISGSWFEPAELGPQAPTASDSESFPVHYRGEVLAVLELPPRRGESTMTRRDRRVVDGLLAQAAPALDAARTVVALRESRARTVAAREEERRRIRRELHDDLGPTLSGLALSAAALATRTGDPEARQLHRELRMAVEQSRELAYGLRPPVLDDHGLVAALHDRIGGPDVRIDAPDHLDLPASVDLAALRIIQEAVTNARKHGAPPVLIRLRLDDGHLRLTVSDAGPGLPADVRPGIGMLSITERTDEVGGTARYDRAASGCHLLVDLPLEVS
ncbi:putative Histidine kinase [Nostocoides australiense Ben110]|uniref:histidine kinase n=1 Tax=Nostocoides australiense Ben110 TaxID=1193182 RepID=W6K4I5_9MICO|nr:histidine kinase [Tetrasphaera australiensis]CCH75074.1 putative Histidine kinase [Tetrasphaera australiensis Ben110]